MNFKYDVQMFRSEDLHQWNYKNHSDSRLYTGSDVMVTYMYLLIIRGENLKLKHKNGMYKIKLIQDEDDHVNFNLT